MTDLTAELGSIQLEIESDSNYLHGTLPALVRNAAGRVVAEGKTYTRFDLPPGMYSVEILTPFGERLTEVVELAAGGRERIPFPTPRPELTSNVDEDEVSLISAHGCDGAQRAAGSWEFTPHDALDRVPTARFFIAGTGELDVSVPINPATDHPRNACTISASRSETGVGLTSAFATERMVSAMVAGSIRSGEYVDERGILSEASELLLHKYQDPTGAALGGLALQRIGRLGDRAGWVRNLARSFSWLPDGSILQAALMRDGQREEQVEGLELLLRATRNRPMYTDALSLAMHLLRTWPMTDRYDERHELLQSLARYSSVADWSALTLTVLSVDPPDAEPWLLDLSEEAASAAKVPTAAPAEALVAI